MIPGITLSSDFIAGFCGETEQEYEDTLSLLEHVKYENAFLFAYSLREKTHAHRQYIGNILQLFISILLNFVYLDDVPEEIK